MGHHTRFVLQEGDSSRNLLGTVISTQHEVKVSVVKCPASVEATVGALIEREDKRGVASREMWCRTHLVVGLIFLGLLYWPILWVPYYIRFVLINCCGEPKAFQKDKEGFWRKDCYHLSWMY